jgi:hypothetical protein
MDNHNWNFLIREIRKIVEHYDRPMEWDDVVDLLCGKYNRPDITAAIWAAFEQEEIDCTPNRLLIPRKEPGLTVSEQMILSYLVGAFTLFKDLDAKHPDDDDDFRRAIHDAQKMIALRVARRIDPHIWFQPQEGSHGSETGNQES